MLSSAPQYYPYSIRSQWYEAGKEGLDCSSKFILQAMESCYSIRSVCVTIRFVFQPGVSGWISGI